MRSLCMCSDGLRPCYIVQFSQQLFSQCRCETNCWRIAQYNMGCLAIFLLREALQEVELSSTFCNALQQPATPLHSVSSLQQLVYPYSQFYGSFNAKSACAHFLLFVPRSIVRPVTDKIAQCTMQDLNTRHLATLHSQPLRGKLLRKLHSVTGPLSLHPVHLPLCSISM